MLRVILNKSWRQHPTKQQLYGHPPPIRKTIKIRWIRHVGHCWRNRDELIRDVLWWTPSLGRAKAWRPAQTYRQQLCADTACSPEDLPEAMNDREGWRERVRDICADSVTWWWILTWAQMLSKVVCISHNTNTLGKSMHPTDTLAMNIFINRADLGVTTSQFSSFCFM